MIRRHELSDAEWEFVRPLLPESLRGRKRLDDRGALNGIVRKFRTGTAWRDVPGRYGPRATLHMRFRRWAVDGTFDRMLRTPQAKADATGDVEWPMSVDSTIVRAHQHAAGARKGGSATRPPAGPETVRPAGSTWPATAGAPVGHIRPIFGEYYGDPDWVCLRPNCGCPSQLTIARKAFPTWARRSRRSFSADSDGLKRLEYQLSA
ncbi:transposase [Streptomyces malaysiensis]|uniref:transposase n=1 Tax=Streptomyces malaysiensis TaxID=92644 RepID=UPI003D7C2A93